MCQNNITIRVWFILIMQVLAFEHALFTAQPAPTGEELLKKHIKTAVAKQKGTALQGAKRGAKTAAALIAAGTIAQGQRFGHVDLHGSDAAGMINLITIGVVGGAVLAMLNDAFRKGSSPAWISQLKELDNNISSISKKVIYLGVPLDKVNPALEQGGYVSWLKNLATRSKYVRKAYLLASGFDDIEHAFGNDHYELYLMPKDEYLVDVFLAINELLKNKTTDLGKLVAFVALRPTPGVTKSPFNGKNLPRIIIGFKRGTQPADMKKILNGLDAYFKQAWYNYQDIISLNVQPRYSQKINDLIYAAYGSADYKDEVGAREDYVTKNTSFWRTWWPSEPTNEEMAYPITNRTMWKLEPLQNTVEQSLYDDEL